MSQELEALDPVPERLTLESGTEVIFEQLRARQFFKLLRILTHGALPWLGNSDIMRIDPNDSAEDLGGKLIAMTLMALPDAEEEALDFVRSMVKPVGLIDKPAIALNKSDKATNELLWTNLYQELENPELGDLVSIIEGVIKRESEDLTALGKRLQGMLKLAQKTGQLPDSLISQTPSTSTSSEDSAEPSTSSNPATDGQMKTVESSLLGDYDKSSQSSENNNSTTPVPVPS